jgi:hypothetical protein
VPFAYYDRLSPRQKKIYQASDGIARLQLPAPEALWPAVAELRGALAGASRPATQRAAAALMAGIHQQLGVPPVDLVLLAARPSRSWGELHGLYEPAERGRKPRITLWMRTAQRRQVVAFRTFLRTLLHEVCHHLDYELLDLADSFHTEGFYKRESSLFHQLVPSPVEEEAAGSKLREGSGSV